VCPFLRGRQAYRAEGSFFGEFCCRRRARGQMSGGVRKFSHSLSHESDGCCLRFRLSETERFHGRGVMLGHAAPADSLSRSMSR